MMFMMYAIALAMLTVPGLIALYIHRGGVRITAENWQEMLVEYLILSFLILTLDYGLMFISYPPRTVSFVPSYNADSALWSASFIFKYSFAALLFAVLLPYAHKRREKISRWGERWLARVFDASRAGWERIWERIREKDRPLK
ncbi:MAG: hypothetical protein LBK98_04215 [Peptococcaceae bacterium]|jgi:hypothetical protein|nr:hypothetical protein [Peptococcaceae bacterium]